MSDSPGEVTLLLGRLKAGDPAAQSQLMNVVYDELRRLAAKLMRDESPGHSLQATALVNEAYMRLVNVNEVDWQGRAHFFAIAAQIMRRVLVDHARHKKAQKRGGGQGTLNLDDAVVFASQHSPQLLALDEALSRLEQIDPRKSRIVEMRFFAGLTEDEVAGVLGIAPRTVKREWSFARAWLHAEMQL
ncbi:MAG: sigma-70 family RNA polymerase sigma factor [Bryobacterales bacterium]|nr:sigma-70 family RNA polymerase sigma factor [Bryobacterales bacterium]